jgi:hypothetical protein
LFSCALYVSSYSASGMRAFLGVFLLLLPAWALLDLIESGVMLHAGVAAACGTMGVFSVANYSRPSISWRVIFRQWMVIAGAFLVLPVLAGRL